MDLGRFTVVEESHAPGSVLPWHAHDVPLLTLVLRGRHEEAIGTHRFDVHPYDVVLKPGGVRHQDRVGGSRGLALLAKIRTDSDSRGLRHLCALPAPRHLRTAAVRHLVHRAAMEWQSPDQFSGLALEATLLDLLVIAARPASRTSTKGAAPEWLRLAEEFMHDAFDRTLTLDEIAMVSGVHPAHLARGFRRHKGCSVGDYLRTVRVDAAARWLTETDWPLAEVAARSGFFDQSHMGRHIRRRFGVPPGDLRRRYRPRHSLV